MAKEKATPISPKETVHLKEESIPNEVIEVFNELITENIVGDQAVVHQKDIVELLVKKGLNRSQIFEKHWLDVEDIYRKAGWKVEYDKPGYNETYEPHFVFTAKKSRTTR